MSKYHDVRGVASYARDQRLGQVTGRNNVVKQESQASELEELGFLVTKSRFVCIAGHCRYRRDLFQFTQYCRAANVSPVQHVLNPVEMAGNLRIEIIVRV